MATATQKPQKSIRNPQKWIGKRVHHMANWMDFQWLRSTNDQATDDYFVDEWTGKLWRACDQGNWNDYFNAEEEAQEAGYDPCYYYSSDGLARMAGLV